MHNKYYAVFTKTDEAVEVDFPDLQGCLTFGKDFDEAYEMAIDALSGWLAHAEKEFIKPPTGFDILKKKYTAESQTIFPVPIDEKIMQSYAPKKRINVVFPVDVLSKIDETRGKIGERDRSKFITDGMREYTQKFAE